ncbi:MAG: T9SS type A sorting domain-containing protein, partial [Bacteroidota bacterium]
FTVGINLDQYPLNYGTGSENDAREQLQNYPGPRYRPEHGLRANIPFFGTPNLLGHYQDLSPVASPASAMESADIIKELVENYHYMVPFFQNQLTPARLNNDQFESRHLAIWASMPQNQKYPRTTISYWLQLHPDDMLNPSGTVNTPHQYFDAEDFWQPGFVNLSCTATPDPNINGTAYIARRDLPAALETYTNNNVSPYFPCGAAPCGVTGTGQPISRWSFAGPLSYANEDGKTLAGHVYHLFDQFPLLKERLDYMAENGEEPPVCQDPNDLATTTQMAAIPINFNNYDDYRGFRKVEFRMTYEDAVLEDVDRPALLSDVLGHKTSPMVWYEMDGRSRIYPRLREINMNESGTRAYPTPSIYPNRANRWFNSAAALTGLEEITLGKDMELSFGDDLFAPYVSPQINDRDENGNGNYGAVDEHAIRPGQWLGLLKVLSGMGAEYFHEFLFNVPQDAPNFTNVQYPEWYIWQTSTPAYAQAITSRYEDILRDSELLQGDWNNYIAPVTTPRYLFWAGNAQTPTAVRRYNQNQDRYLIATSVQQTLDSPLGENTPRIDSVSINLNAGLSIAPNTLRFESRRQGSVYLYDESNYISPAGNKRPPVFYQLDRWHQVEHPEQWRKDFFFEAEVFDASVPPSNLNNDVFEVWTDRLTATPGDFTIYDSYMTIETPDAPICYGKNGPALDYGFQVKDLNSQGTLYAFVRARSKSGDQTGMHLTLNPDGNSQTHSIGCVSQMSFQWYALKLGTNNLVGFTTNLGENIIRIQSENAELEIDRFVLSASPSPSDLFGTQPVSPITTLCNYAVVPDFTHSVQPGFVVDFTDISSGTNAGSTFEWHFGDGNTSTIQHPSHTYTSTINGPSPPGYFLVTLIVDGNYCITKKIKVAQINKRTPTPNLPFNLTAFPNPFDDHTNIVVTSDVEAPLKVTITDAFGREIAVLAERKVRAGEEIALEWEAGQTADGLYFVQVRLGERVKTLKLFQRRTAE